MIRLLLIALVSGLSLGLSPGCSNPINAHTAQNYHQLGVDAEKVGDLDLARRNFSRAYGNTQLGNLGPAAEAYALYEYARVSGYAGATAEAVQGFRDVLALIDRAKGEADRLRPPALCEYARLLHRTGQHLAAVPVFDQALAALETTDVRERDPRGLADLLDQFAISLRESGDSERAREIVRRAAGLRSAN